MKRNRFKCVIATAGLTLCMAVGAHAANYTVQADSLHEMGLFQGTDIGYALERTPTRAEAATMLVRLLGQEEAAQQLDSTLPFTDLVGGEAPYVAYLYENGLTTGVTDTSFAPGEPCDMQMYSAFLLRALGYREDAGDFAYADALQLAAEKGIYEPGIFGADGFLRDDMVAMSYCALAADMKNGGSMLLEVLIGQGAVQTDAAVAAKNSFSAYRQYRDTFSAMESATEIFVSGETENALYNSSGTIKLQSTSTLSVRWDFRMETMYAQEHVTISAPNVADMQVDDERTRIGTVLSVTQNGESFLVDSRKNAHGYRVVPLVYVNAVEQTDAGYKIDCSSSYLPHCIDVFGAGVDAIGTTGQESITALTITQTQRDGMLGTQTAQLDAVSLDASAVQLKSTLSLGEATQ